MGCGLIGGDVMVGVAQRGAVEHLAFHSSGSADVAELQGSGEGISVEFELFQERDSQGTEPAKFLGGGSDQRLDALQVAVVAAGQSLEDEDGVVVGGRDLVGFAAEQFHGVGVAFVGHHG